MVPIPELIRRLFVSACVIQIERLAEEQLTLTDQMFANSMQSRREGEVPLHIANTFMRELSGASVVQSRSTSAATQIPHKRASHDVVS